MPWSDPNPTPDQLKRRIAILIRRRCREQGVKQIAMRALVHRDTVRAYSDAAFHAKTSNGPVIFETIVSILKATGDHPGQVLWAAMESSDEKSFMEMLATDMTGQMRNALSKAPTQIDQPAYRLISVSYPLSFNRKPEA